MEVSWAGVRAVDGWKISSGRGRCPILLRTIFFCSWECPDVGKCNLKTIMGHYKQIRYGRQQWNLGVSDDLI
eukprot:scaffold6871_cov113-Skeletonema_marinoi.AAC.2